MAEKRWQWADWIAIIAIAAIIAGGSYGLWYYFLKVDPSTQRTVKDGDKLSTEYVGWFDDGTVFDTSQWDVAKDNFSYPKAISFELRRQADYKPFEFTIGKDVIACWSEGVVGMTVAEVRRLDCPKEKAYNSVDPGKIEVRQLVVDLPLVIEMNDTSFQNNYSNAPAVGMVVKDLSYGWPVRVLALESGVVTAVNVVEAGQEYQTKWPWKVRVLDVDSAANGGKGSVKARHLLTAADANHIKGQEGASTYYVTDVDETGSKFTVDRNRFTDGKTIHFKMKLLKFV